MGKYLSPERVDLLNRLVEDHWPLMEMQRTHGIDYRTVKRYHPEYRGLPLKEASQLGVQARRANAVLRRNHPILKVRAS